jgi:putative flippase GtrA
LLVGCANTAVGFGIIVFARLRLSLGDVSANILGYACGLTLSYFLYCPSPSPSAVESAKRAAFPRRVTVAYGVNLGALLTGIDALHIPSPLTQAGAMVCYTGVFY